MAEIRVQVNQSGSSSSLASIRTHQVSIDRPVEKGGEDQGAMGGELLLASLGGCFMSNLLAAIKSREAKIAKVHLEIVGTLEQAPGRYSAIEMTVRADHSDKDDLEKLVLMSERACIVANTLRNAVNLTIKVV